MDLNQITLPAVDMAASVDFYKRLGLIQIVDSPHYARFESPDGPATFSLHLADRRPDHDVVVYFECDDLDERFAELQRKGFVFEQAPADQRWCWREARLKDPGGNTICLYYAGENRKNPPWRI